VGGSLEGDRLGEPEQAVRGGDVADLYGEATSPWTEAMLTTRPHPRSYIPPMRSLVSRNGAVSITARITSQRASSKDSIALTCWRSA